MSNLNKIQDFFNNNPVLAGILVFVIISSIVIITWLIIFFGSKKLVRVKREKNKIKKEKIKVDKSIKEKRERKKWKLNWSWKLNRQKKNRKIKSKKDKNNNNWIEEKNGTNPTASPSKPLTDFVVDFDKNGQLILKNITKKEIIDNPSKQDYYDIIILESSRLFLPEDYVELEIDPNDLDKTLKTSKPIKDRNLYVFNLLNKFLNKNDVLWAVSKFN